MLKDVKAAILMGIAGVLLSSMVIAENHEEVQSLPTPSDELGINIIGDDEAPKSLIIVPWKPPQAGDLIGRPANSLLNGALAPIDRDEFVRDIQYYQIGIQQTLPTEDKK